MAAERQRPAGRKPRADAERNRERLLAVAKEVFARSGADASLDEVAKRAGVGPGTLYRHFPTREALLEAVYRTEVEKLAAAGRRLAAERPPGDALRAWLLLFVDYIAAKKIIAPALSAVVCSGSTVAEESYARIRGAVRDLIGRAVASGDVRADVDPVDFLGALVGVAHMPADAGWERSARRLVDILVAGSRPPE